MGINIKFSDLYRAPEINPINRKARSIPAFNPINMYGRVFFFSWFGFMVAFWAWYTFPPLLTVTIKADLHLSTVEVANSNIVSLVATLFVRAVAGPLCDYFGSRKVFSGILLLGTLPIGLAPLIQNVTGLYISRFFIGILGGAFVPCQVWSTGFFDKNVVGTANGLAGGFGNAGGGITYFIMPAVFDAFYHKMGYTAGQAWRLTFIVPLVILLVCGIGMLLLCPDTPTGRWQDRALHAGQNLESHGVHVSGNENLVVVPGAITDKATSPSTSSVTDSKEDPEKKAKTVGFDDHEVAISRTEMMETFQGETVVKPSMEEARKVLLSPQTWFHILTYVCSFGGELAINSILGAYYLKNFPWMGQTLASNWAAMFGFLNFVTRPLGGVIGDVLYNMGGRNLWLKKGWISICGVLTGILLIVIGRLDPHDVPTMMGLIALMSIFHEGGNGANFALVPHVHPHANGILSGLTGAGGNLGGVIFAIIFRFMDGGSNYAKAIWIIGVIHIGVNLAVCWIPPLPRGQIGGH